MSCDLQLTCKLSILLHVAIVEVQFILEVGTSIGALQEEEEREQLISKCICKILSEMSQIMCSNDEIRPNRMSAAADDFPL